MQNIPLMTSKFVNFIKTDIWRIRLKEIPRPKSFFIKQLRIFLLAINEFNKDKCPLRASALTFYSLLSIVPLAAMAFGVAKGFGFEKRLQTQLLERFPGQEEALVQIINFAHSLLETTKGGLIAGIGIAVLIWTVIKVLGNIESSFNHIWEIIKARTFGRKFSDYLSMILISPVLVIISSSVTVYITTQVTVITERIAMLGIFSPLIFFILKLLPYCLIWALFTFVYILMPNCKVDFASGLFAGIVAGTIFQVAQLAYVTFQLGIVKYNAIYGSFAALPLFLVWLELSWLIVLFGAELSFAHQNADNYEFEPDALRINYSFKILLSLHVAHLLIKHFSEGQKPLTATQISRTLKIPIRLVYRILHELAESGILSHAKSDEYKELAYQPAKDINLFTIKYIIDALEKRGSNDIPVAQTEEFKVLSNALQTFSDTIEKSPANGLLREI
jgi:membrane protein